MIEHRVHTFIDGKLTNVSTEVQVFVGIEDGDIDTFVVVYPMELDDIVINNEIELYEWIHRQGYGRIYLSERIVI
jgi:hypothetical protein